MVESVKMTVPTDMSYLHIVQNFVAGVAGKYGFVGDDIAKIEIAVEEAMSNVVKHAFTDGETGSFELICEKIQRGIKIIIREKGLPFDPERLPRYDPALGAENTEVGGLGIFMMKKCMDGVEFYNLGSEGKEMHMIKNLPAKDILQYFPPSELTVETVSPSPGPKVITEKIPYDVRLMEPGEAVEVARGAYKSHGYTFFDESVYYPKK